MHVQDAPEGTENADHAYSLVFRNVRITSGAAWPWGDSRELRTGDLARAVGE